MFMKVAIFTAFCGLAMAHMPVMHEVQHAPQPYKFGYNIKDKHGDQYREETGDGHSGVKGSYGFTDARGIKRQVNYVADHAGFRAQIKTNEPGTANQNPAAVQMISDAPYGGGVAFGGMDYGYGGYGLGNGYGYGLENGIYGNDYGYDGYGFDGRGYEGMGYDRVYRGMNGLGYGGYGLGLGILGGLGYARYGY